MPTKAAAQSVEPSETSPVSVGAPSAGTIQNPSVLFEAEAFRIVRLRLPPKLRDPQDATDEGWRNWIEVRDGQDLMGEKRWKRLEQRGEGVSTYARICHALKNELLRQLCPDLATEREQTQE